MTSNKTLRKNRKKIGLILSLVITCACLSCKKAVVPPTYNFSKEGLSYIQLSIGKYFIYKDSTTAQSDSVVVTKSSLLSFQSSSLGYLYNGESYTLELTKVNAGKDSVWLSGTATAALSSNIYMLAVVGSGYLFRYPPCNCGSTANVPSGVESTIPTMVVEGKTYTNVILTQNISAVNVQTAYYWAKGIGLIKRVDETATGTETYTLLRNN